MATVDYHQYLASREWALKREAVKQRAGFDVDPVPYLDPRWN